MMQLINKNLCFSIKKQVHLTYTLAYNFTNIIRNTYLPIGDSIFDVIACSVNKHSTIIPSSRLHACILMN